LCSRLRIRRKDIPQKPAEMRRKQEDYAVAAGAKGRASSQAGLGKKEQTGKSFGRPRRKPSNHTALRVH
jgi:hypothetical protein